MGTPSNPLLPGLGAGFSVPSVLSGASFCPDVFPCVPDLPPLVTASTMAITAPIARTPAPAHMSIRRCLALRASRARISAALALATSRSLLALATDSALSCQGWARG